MKKSFTFKNLIRRVHEDEKGAVSLETILIIGAIALPVLIFLISVAWPRIQEYFEDGMNDLEDQADRARTSGSGY